MRVTVVGSRVGLHGLEEYLNDLAVGSTSGLRVIIKWSSVARCYFRGTAWRRSTVIRVSRPQYWKFPWKLNDRYVSRYKRLESLSSAPKYARNLQEVIGFIFLHELAHLKYHRLERNRSYKGEWRCTLFAYEHWKPIPDSMIEIGRIKEEAECRIQEDREEVIRQKVLYLKSRDGRLEKARKWVTVYASRVRRYTKALKKWQRRVKLYERRRDVVGCAPAENCGSGSDRGVDSQVQPPGGSGSPMDVGQSDVKAQREVGGDG